LTASISNKESRQTNAKKNKGIMKAASIVTLPFTEVDADAFFA
jgi:hypothetical protein